MGSFICQQPNGLYCRFSSVVDCPTHHNMTKEDYINFRMEMAKEEAIRELEFYLRPFPWVEMYFKPMNMTQEEFDRIMEEMKKEVQHG